MITLTFIVCTYAGMINDSLYQVRGCHPVQLVASEDVSLFQCLMFAQVQIASWRREHPDTIQRRLVIQKYTCEPADRIRADL
jgi:hypothetical protein